MRFDLPKEHNSLIKVIGVGGGGSNAVNYMYDQGIKGVDFIICNTDAQALESSPVPTKVQLGATLTAGRGAGSIPEVGRNAAVETLEEIKALIGEETTMVFVTAGMGGGTGTGAAPVIAQAARELGILTVGIVTVPFMFEGRKRMHQADHGLTEMRDAVDTLLIINNDKLRELYGNLTLGKAFGHADEVLCTAAKGIAEVITLTGQVNVDMNDVNTVMRDSGVAIMGSGRAAGEGRAIRAVQEALESPLLNDNDITGANFVLLNITYGGDEVLMDEIMEITDFIQDQAGMSAEVIWGYGPDQSLETDLCVTVIATGFQSQEVDANLTARPAERRVMTLNPSAGREITGQQNSPTQTKAAPEPQEEEAPFLKTADAAPTAEPVTAPVFIAPTPLTEPDVLEDFVLKTAEETTLPTTEHVTDDTVSLPDLFAEVRTPQDSLDIQAESPELPETPALGQRFELADDSLATDLTKDTDALKFTEITSRDSGITQDRPPRQELVAKNKEREQRIRELTMKLKTPSGLTDLESEPAYKRRGVALDNTPHSSESSVSRYALGEEENQEGEKDFKLKDNNPFLHDNVD